MKRLTLICLAIIILSLTAQAQISSKNLLIISWGDEDISIQEISPTGKLVSTPWRDHGEEFDVPFIRYENYSLFIAEDLSLYMLDFNTNTKIDLPISTDGYPAGFLKNSPIVVYGGKPEDENIDYINLYNYETDELVQSFTGYCGAVAALDDTIFFLEETKKGVNINSYTLGDPKPTLRQEIKWGVNNIYELNDIVALTREYYVYLVGDDYEYRFYTPEGPFYDGGMSYATGQPKFQSDLVFSVDGKLAAFTERNPEEIPYLVVIDLVKQKRITTKYYGLYPYIQNGLVYFLSQPTLVKTKKPEGEDINPIALYAFDPVKSSLKLVYKLDNTIELLHNQ